MITGQLFKEQRQGLSPVIQSNRWIMGTFAAIAILGTGLPVLNPAMGKFMKLVGLSLGFTSAAAFTGMAGAAARSVKIDESLDKAQLESLKRDLAAEAQFDYAVGKIRTDARVVGMLETLPESMKRHYLNEFGLAGLVAPPPMPQAEAARSGVGNLHELNLDKWRDANGLTAQTCEQLYAKCIGKSVIFTGNKGEGKTVAAHFALRQWAETDPNLVIFAFDKHYGMNDDPRFASNWLGIPQVEGIPKNVQTCVVKAGGDQLERFLRRVDELLEYRIANNVGGPKVVVVIDEFTNLLSSLENKQVEAISNILDKISTEARKYGIDIWYIQHSLTKEDLGNGEVTIKRLILRGCEIVMGAQMTQDRVQVSNSPRSIPASAIDHAQSIYRDLGDLPAGFATSLPVPDGYLPVPFLPNGLADLIMDWKGAKAPDVVVPKNVDPQTPPTHDPTIKGRDIHESNPMRDYYKEMRAWYHAAATKPTNQELRVKWHALTGKMFQSDPPIDKLREILERKA